MPLEPKRYLIWDFDGTLGYRDGGWSGSMHEVLQDHGRAQGITATDLRNQILTGFRWHDPHRAYSPAILADAWWEELDPLFTRAYILGARLDEATARKLAREVRRKYLQPERWRLFDDSADALAALSRRGYTHLLLSNHVPELPQILKLLRIDACFARIFNSAEIGYEKPHPKAYSAVLDHVGAALPATMIGDNPTADYAGAKAAGLKAILVRRATPGLEPYYATLDELAEDMR